MSHPFFLASLLWNFGLGMTWLSIPLYAHAQGLSNAEIAGELVVSIPVFQVGSLYQKEGGARIERSSGNPALDKAALDIVGLAGGQPRPPLLPLSREATTLVRTLLHEAGVPAVA